MTLDVQLDASIPIDKEKELEELLLHLRYVTCIEALLVASPAEHDLRNSRRRLSRHIRVCL